MKRCKAHKQVVNGGSINREGEGKGSPLRCSCLENTMDRGAWRATVHGVAGSWTRLSTAQKQRSAAYLSGASDSSEQASLCRSAVLCYQNHRDAPVRPVQSHCTSNTRARVTPAA